MIRTLEDPTVHGENIRNDTRSGESHTHTVDVPRQTAAALALMETGVRDLSVIADAVGLTTSEVKQIDQADDPRVRKLGVDGIPDGLYFRLRHNVRCPGCAASITVAPCVTCQVRRDLRGSVR